MKKLTVGITVYNNGVFLEELLFIIKQEFTYNEKLKEDVDVIIYDDCSNEVNTLNVLGKYNDLFLIVRNEINSTSPARGRNYIIDKSESEYVLFIDGDDTLVASIGCILEEITIKKSDVFVSDVVKIGPDGIQNPSPFIFSNELFKKHYGLDEIKKMSVHQTGIWSIYNVPYLKRTGVRYNEETRYEDNFFMSCLYLEGAEIKTIGVRYYGWRTNRKSFTNSEESFNLRVEVYEKIIKKLTSEENINKQISSYLYYSIWNQTYGNLIRNYPKMKNNIANMYWNKLKHIDKKIGWNKVKKVKHVEQPYLKTHAKFIFKFTKTVPYICIIFLRIISNILKGKSKIKAAILKVFFLIPLDSNKLFFTSHYGDFCDNTKYLYLQYRKNNDKKLIFAVKNPEELNKRYNTKDFIQYDNKLLFFFHHYTASTIYLLTWNSPLISKRKGQIWEQLWHGIPIKKIYADVETYFLTSTDESQKNKEIAIGRWDKAWSVNEYNTKIFNKLFPHVTIIEKQYPKIEWLIEENGNSNLKNELCIKYGLSTTEKKILYAPTYRPYRLYIDVLEVIKDLNHSDQNFTLIIHPHPMMRVEWINVEKVKVVFLEKADDIQEVILISEALITDYSSIFYDFKVLNKKIFYYENDLDIYTKIHGIYKNNYRIEENDEGEKYV